MKTEFTKSHAQLISVALDTALPGLMLSRHDEEYLFAFQQSFLDCNGFSIHFNFDRKKTKTEFTKSHAQLIAVALDSALPRLMLNDDFSKHDEEFLFSLELCFLDCNGFSIHFNEEKSFE